MSYHDKDNNIKIEKVLLSLGFSVCFWVGFVTGFFAANLIRYLQD